MSMFELVAAMNTAFGNPKGSPDWYPQGQDSTGWARLQKQCANIGGTLEFARRDGLGYSGEIKGEVLELLHALQDRDVDKVRDGLCNIMVFALGAYHFLGYDVEADMKAVVDGVMSRFCKDQEELVRTRQKYIGLGIPAENLYTTGEFPRMALKVAVDCKDNRGEHYPAGKFLKSVAYRDTVLPPAPTPAPPPAPHPLAVGDRRFFKGNYGGTA